MPAQLPDAYTPPPLHLFPASSTCLAAFIPVPVVRVMSRALALCALPDLLSPPYACFVVRFASHRRMLRGVPGAAPHTV